MSTAIRVNGSKIQEPSTGLDVLDIQGVASAVNAARLTNAATGSKPALKSYGSDADVGLDLQTQGAGEVTANGKRLTPNVAMVSVEDLAADADIATRPVWVAPAGGATITKIGIVLQGSAAGVDAGNTVVVLLDDSTATIVTKTYNNVTTPPSSGVYDSLGTLDVTHKVLGANGVVRLSVTQGATANMPAFLVAIEWAPN